MFVGLIQAIRRLTSELARHRASVNSNTVALNSVAVALEKLAEAPPVETTAEWKTGTIVPE